MKLLEDGPKYGLKHIAVIKYSQCKHSNIRLVYTEILLC
jgi:hypothetical protein